MPARKWTSAAKPGSDSFGEVVEPDSPDVDAAYAVFSGARTAGADGARALTLTLYAMLQDPRMVYY